MTQVPALFADAGYWIALWNPRDILHARAIGVANGLTLLTNNRRHFERLQCLTIMSA